MVNPVISLVRGRLQENKYFGGWQNPWGLVLLLQKVVASCVDAVVVPGCPTAPVFLHITPLHHNHKEGQQSAGRFSQFQNTGEKMAEKHFHNNRSCSNLSTLVRNTHVERQTFPKGRNKSKRNPARQPLPGRNVCC